MGIFSKNTSIDYVYYKDKPIQFIYYGIQVIWQAIHSCFGGGYWINDKGWDNTDSWKNQIK